MNFSNTEIWIVIVLLGVGTFLIRFSFLGLIGDRDLPAWVLKALRYTPVAVMPGLVAPLILWPDVNGGEPDPARLVAAAVTLAVGVWRRSVVWAVVAGMATLYLMMWLLG